MEIEHAEHRKKMNEQLWDANEKLTRQVKEALTDLTTTQAERDNFKALWEQARKERERFVKDCEVWALTSQNLEKDRDEWKERAERWNKEREEWAIAHTKVMSEKHEWVKKCDEARAFANDLREYLDRALKIVKEQNEQLEQLTFTQGWNGKVAARDSCGRFAPVPTPVKHLREVNEEQAKKPRPISSVKRNEVIRVNNNAERDGILQLMDAEGWKWRAGEKPNEYIPKKSYPYVLDYDCLGDDSIGVSSIQFHEGKKSILPASDFLPAEQAEPTEARPDHPCLKGCSKPDACFCPPGTPRDGQVEVRHSRKDLIVMGCNLTETPNTFHEDKLLIDAWAKKIGLVHLSAQDGGRSFVFSRPAMNSDFDVPNTTQP